MQKKSWFYCRTLVSVIILSVLLSADSMADRPIVIAHRGASGYLPEHTLAAKALAFGMGADYLEQDLVLSKDGVPVVLHDIHIDTVTDVATIFPDRKREDGRFYALDFTVAEIKQLSVSERRQISNGQAVFANRFPVGNTALTVPTFEEELVLIAGMNRSTGRTVGIYPEIKNPWWHQQQGVDLSRAVLDILAKYDYQSKQDACWLQCFEYHEVRLRSELGWNGRLVQLLARGGTNVDGTDYEHLRTKSGLGELAKLVDGIGPEISSIVEGSSTVDRRLTSLVADAHEVGLVVHPYTIRADALPRTVRTIDDLHDLLFNQARVDGAFTDFPDLMAIFLKQNR